ncbi:hypothetical protein ACFOWM_11455 [Ferruginibacter yonginensis]|uniref:Outer membrane lipoprotein-sorting protein n=1 Tax=Ferruginibacter yonginensis TaxID=1310416 RepID=A0ABV8QV36_9BACT
MKLFKNVMMAAALVASLHANAQTADEIVAKHIEGMGGAAKLATLTSVKKTGTLSAQGYDIPVVMTVLQQKGFRLDLDIMGTANYQVVTPQKGFIFFPIQGMTEPKDFDEDQLKAAQGSLEIQSAFLNYKDKGMSVELLGTEKYNNADVFKLKVTNKAGKVSTMFVDSKNYRLLKVVSKSKAPDGSEVDQETTYDDYKQNADGFWFSYSSTTPQGTIVFDKIESNIKVDENIFKN